MPLKRSANGRLNRRPQVWSLLIPCADDAAVSFKVPIRTQHRLTASNHLMSQVSTHCMHDPQPILLPTMICQVLPTKSRVTGRDTRRRICATLAAHLHYPRSSWKVPTSQSTSSPSVQSQCQTGRAFCMSQRTETKSSARQLAISLDRNLLSTYARPTWNASTPTSVPCIAWKPCVSIGWLSFTPHLSSCF